MAQEKRPYDMSFNVSCDESYDMSCDESSGVSYFVSCDVSYDVSCDVSFGWIIFQKSVPNRSANCLGAVLK